MTASVTGSPRNASASCLSFWSTIALISGGAYSLPSASTRTSLFGPWTTVYGTIVISSFTSENLRPMKRLIEKTVFGGFVTCCRRAGVPTSRWPSFVNATTEGVVRPPSAFGMTVGSPPSSTAMHEFVVPRSMPIVLAISGNCLLVRKSKRLYSRYRLPLDRARRGSRAPSGGRDSIRAAARSPHGAATPHGSSVSPPHRRARLRRSRAVGRRGRFDCRPDSRCEAHACESGGGERRPLEQPVGRARRGRARVVALGPGVAEDDRRRRRHRSGRVAPRTARCTRRRLERAREQQRHPRRERARHTRRRHRRGAREQSRWD